MKFSLPSPSSDLKVPIRVTERMEESGLRKWAKSKKKLRSLLEWRKEWKKVDWENGLKVKRKGRDYASFLCLRVVILTLGPYFTRSRWHLFTFSVMRSATGSCLHFVKGALWTLHTSPVESCTLVEKVSVFTATADSWRIYRTFTYLIISIEAIWTVVTSVKQRKTLLLKGSLTYILVGGRGEIEVKECLGEG